MRPIYYVSLLLIVSACASIERSPHGVENVLRRSESIGTQLDKEWEEKASEEEGRSPASTDVPTFWWPLKEVSVHSRFGARGRHHHTGVDLKAKMDTPVYASYDGIVVYAGDAINGYGKTIIVRHIRNFATLYAHLLTIGVEEGERVERGHCIAYSGDSGRVSGPHLHFEVREGEKPIDPVRMIERKPKITPRQVAKEAVEPVED